MEENERLKEQIMELSKSLNQGTRLNFIWDSLDFYRKRWDGFF